jgi:hypothetical protein
MYEVHEAFESQKEEFKKYLPIKIISLDRRKYSNDRRSKFDIVICRSKKI